MTVRRLAPPALLLALAGLLSAQPQPEAEPPQFGIPPGEVLQQVMLASTAGEEIDWSVKSLQCPDAWKATKGRGVKVAVLDTGCDLDHRDLKPAIDASQDFTRSRYGASDRNGHGTHCAGSIGARENGWGLVGCAPECRLIIAKVLGDGGSGGVDGIAKGMAWADEQGADVMSFSLGGGGSDGWIPPVAKRLTAKGTILIAAAGNSGPREGTVGYPGAYPEFIAVAAVDSGLNTARFSSRGKAVFVAGPGVQVRSTIPGSGGAPDGLFGTMSGTSMATPNIAGIAALWVAAHPEVPRADRPARFREALIKACKDLAPTGRDTATGYGFPSAVNLTDGAQPAPSPPPSPVVPPPDCPPCPDCPPQPVPEPPPPYAGGWASTVGAVAAVLILVIGVAVAAAACRRGKL